MNDDVTKDDVDFAREHYRYRGESEHVDFEGRFWKALGEGLMIVSGLAGLVFFLSVAE